MRLWHSGFCDVWLVKKNQCVLLNVVCLGVWGVVIFVLYVMYVVGGVLLWVVCVVRRVVCVIQCVSRCSLHMSDVCVCMRDVISELCAKIKGSHAFCGLMLFMCSGSCLHVECILPFGMLVCLRGEWCLQCVYLLLVECQRKQSPFL